MYDTVFMFGLFLVLWGGAIAYVIYTDNQSKKRIRKIIERKKIERSRRQKGGY